MLQTEELSAHARVVWAEVNPQVPVLLVEQPVLASFRVSLVLEQALVLPETHLLRLPLLRFKQPEVVEVVEVFLLLPRRLPVELVDSLNSLETRRDLEG